ncbi:MAG TPA: amidase [Bryobacteraceae bacterium]|nr:amidase [Bryobacteraceae bacterium]
MTILEAASALRARRVSSVELTTEALARIRCRNPELNAFLSVTEELALAQAAAADSELARGSARGPLHGIPVAYKDLFLTRGIRTTAGSRLYENYVPDRDAAVVEKLSAAGAVCLGKLNLHELAYGITSANPHYGPVRNPWNPAHSPGGSSGGSGAAVAAGLCFAAMGSDTGGSIRIPAAFCGTVGLKPTYGVVSRYGTFPLGYSLDHMGPLTASVRDAAVVLNAIAGHDPRDPASSRRAVPDYLPPAECAIRGLRIGVPENFYFERIDPEVEGSVRSALARAESLGASLRPVRVPDMDALNAVARILLLAEASAVHEAHLRRDRSRFGADVLALLDQGRLIPAPDYVNAQRLRRRMAREFSALWRECDCLATPTTPTAAPPVGATTMSIAGREEDVRLATTRFMRGINALGLPAISIPCGLTAAGLPVGLQIVGPAFQEPLILRLAAALEDSGPVISLSRLS